MATFRQPSEVLRYVFWGALTGIGIGCVGAIFQILIYYIGQGKFNLIYSFSDNIYLKVIISISISALFIILAIIIMKRFAPETNGSGVPHIEGVLEGKLEMNWRRVLPVKFFAGIYALSSGLVLGREGPSIQMGGAIGQFFAEKSKNFDKPLMMCLIAAGAGAGLGTAFNAPLAGILFVVEEMRHQFDYSFKAMQAVIIACVMANLCLLSIFGFFELDVRTIADIIVINYQSPEIYSYWIFIVCGLCFGILGVIFNHYLIISLNFFARLGKYSYWIILFLISCAVGILYIFFPYAINGGYEVIPKALGNEIPINMIILLVIIRMITTCISYGTGIVGGIFAPLLAIGTTFGMLFGLICNYFIPEIIPNPQVFAIVGMAALFTACVGAPLTGIVLVLEMTMNFNLILPLIITCFSATISAIFMGGMPIYSNLLERTLILMKRKKAYLKWSKKRWFFDTFNARKRHKK